MTKKFENFQKYFKINEEKFILVLSKTLTILKLFKSNWLIHEFWKIRFHQQLFSLSHIIELRIFQLNQWIVFIQTLFELFKGFHFFRCKILFKGIQDVNDWMLTSLSIFYIFVYHFLNWDRLIILNQSNILNFLVINKTFNFILQVFNYFFIIMLIKFSYLLNEKLDFLHFGFVLVHQIFIYWINQNFNHVLFESFILNRLL